jgi:hypothetical protein
LSPIGRKLPILPAVAAMLLAAGSVWTDTARAATCGRPVAYPGDAASAPAFANWMANGAAGRRLPGELPVMAALVESGLRNLDHGDADSVGFFQMRTSIWDQGEYKGYLKNPELQLKWFLDRAAAVRAAQKAAGKGDPAVSERSYGTWIADIERPAARYRGRYQLRLADAQNLVKATCPGLQGINVAAPITRLSIQRRQHPVRSGAIAVRVKCLDTPCIAVITAGFRLPGRRRATRLTSDTAMLPAGGRLTLRVAVPRSVRRRIRTTLPRHGALPARLRISVSSSAGAGNVFVRRIALAR